MAQDPSLAIVPAANNSTQVTIADTANKLGLHDAMRYGTRSLASDVAPKHSLELRLNQVRILPRSKLFFFDFGND
jgi:hypothetical protein